MQSVELYLFIYLIFGFSTLKLSLKHDLKKKKKKKPILPINILTMLI